MTNLLRKTVQRSFPQLSVDQWASFFDFGGLEYPFAFQQTLSGHKELADPNVSFEGLVLSAYKSNGVVFACMLARMVMFSQARFTYRQRVNGRPGKMYGTKALSLLEKPWPNGVTADLLARAMQDVDLAGNFFAVRRPNRIKRLPPNWVTIVLGSYDDPSVEAGDADAEVVGYIFHPGGRGSGRPPQFFLPEEMAHFAPIPDPLASFRGMSWLVPVIREYMSDTAMTVHKMRFFENGAPQPLDARVLTPAGWTTMGEVRVSDRVIGRDGASHNVIAVYPQGECDIYKVTFSGGASTECTADHLWRVATAYDRQRGVFQDIPLSQIVSEGTHYASGPARWSVPLVDPVQFDSTDVVPMDPYLLGALLGDGCLRPNSLGNGGVSFASGADDASEWVNLLAPTLPDKMTISRQNRPDGAQLYFKGTENHDGVRRNQLSSLAREIGVWGKIGYEKEIPETYMRASIEDRVSLLQGLIDTDGSIYRSQVFFGGTSEKLVRQVAELAASLGGRVRVVRASDRSGETNRRPQWRLSISRLPAWIVPCRLSRKVAAYTPPSNRSPRHQYIVKVELVGRKQAQCIRLDGAESLYVTDDFVVTHNTPNMVVTMDPSVKKEAFKEWVQMFSEKHEGVLNAYKTLYLGAGAQVTPVGKDFRQMDFAVTQAIGETRICSAAGVPPVLVGVTEGIKASTYSNYQQAKRYFADGTLRYLWTHIASSMESIVPTPAGSELWFDTSDIPFLSEDAKDAAEVHQQEAAAIKSLIDAGFDPDSVVEAVTSGDLTLLAGNHSGLYSVQLQPPGTKLGVPGEAKTPVIGPGTDDKKTPPLVAPTSKTQATSDGTVKKSRRSVGRYLEGEELDNLLLLGSGQEGY
jgi:hypothetical protein